MVKSGNSIRGMAVIYGSNRSSCAGGSEHGNSGGLLWRWFCSAQGFTMSLVFVAALRLAFALHGFVAALCRAMALVP